MKRLINRVLMSLIIAAAISSNSAALGAHPNILLVIADDYGIDSNSLYNTNSKASLPPTPNINALYDSGVLFRNAYACPTCSPSRACILTGRHGFRTGIGLALDGSDNTALPANEPTIPKILTANPQLGYRHASVGKWHLGFKPTDPHVLGGWSHFSGSLSYGVESYFRWSKVVNGAPTTSTSYATTDTVNDALAWIQQQGTNNWFLWLAFNAPHDPFHKPPDNLHSYTSLSGSASDISKTPRLYYEAMTQAMDTELGRLLGQIDRSNTVIILIGDNGTPGEVIQPPYTSNRGKFTLYEGGIRVPMIISGPVVKNARRESTNLVHVVDLYATILELAGADLKTALPQNMPSDSKSLMSVLTDEAQPRRDSVLLEQFPEPLLAPGQYGRAIRDDSYKLIRWKSGLQSVFDLLTDPYERTNLFGRLTVEQSAHVTALNATLAELQTIPQLTDVNHSSTKTAVSVDYVQGVQFSLYRSDNLNTGSWKKIAAAVQRTDFTVTLTDSNATNSENYYRVVAPPR